MNLSQSLKNCGGVNQKPEKMKFSTLEKREEDPGQADKETTTGWPCQRWCKKNRNGPVQQKEIKNISDKILQF